MQKRLYRSRKDQVIGGVCGGIAEYFGVDSVLIRLLAVMAVLVGGGGLIAYVIMWIIIPEAPRGYDYREPETNFEDFSEESEARKQNSQKIFGTGLICLGVYLAVERFIPWDIGEYFWPAILIMGGVFILARRKGDA